MEIMSGGQSVCDDDDGYIPNVTDHQPSAAYKRHIIGRS